MHLISDYFGYNNFKLLKEFITLNEKKLIENNDLTTYKTFDELESYEHKWCYFFKHADDTEDMHELIENSDEVIKKAYHELEAHNWTNEELRAKYKI